MIQAETGLMAKPCRRNPSAARWNALTPITLRQATVRCRAPALTHRSKGNRLAIRLRFPPKAD